ncbi:hypothetical protein BH24PSE2_BH24PSE2_13990 [soil metagenome]
MTRARCPLAASLSLFLLAMLVPFAVSAGPAVDAGAILERIDTPLDTEMPFIETRMNPLLEEPLHLSGRVTFTSGGELTKLIERPFIERVGIARDHVELERDGEITRLSLRRRPGLRNFYRTLRALLEGDAAALLEMFEARATADGDCWTIVLSPSNEPLREFLERMTIAGRGSQIDRIRTVQAQDDWQELSFSR